MRRPSIIFSVLFLSILIQSNIACQTKTPAAAREKYAKAEIIVKFKPDAFNDNAELIAESVSGLNKRFGLVLMQKLSKDTYLLRFSPDLDIIKVVEQYKHNPFVLIAEPNYIISATGKE